jgi:DNA-binding winged helix-turn-helix (wHTH) protein
LITPQLIENIDYGRIGTRFRHMSGLITIGDLTIDESTRRVRLGGREIALSGLSFDLLAFLAKKAPEPVSNAELAEEVWGKTHVTDHTIAQRVAMVRRALGEDSDEPRFIRTVRSKGYAFMLAPAEPAQAAEPTAQTQAWKPAAAGFAAVVALTVSAVVVTGAGSGDEAAPSYEEAGHIIVDPVTGAVRIDNRQEGFMLPVLAKTDGRDLFVGGVPSLDQIEGSEPALGALCSIAEDRSQATTPIPRRLRDLFASPEFETLCENRRG